MGIKGFWKFLRSEFGSSSPSIVEDLSLHSSTRKRQEYDCVYFDVNNFLYVIATTTTDEQKYFLHLYRLFDQIQNKFSPTQTLMLAIDGPAPIMKILTQKYRRLEGPSRGSNPLKFETSQFCPGTMFMDRLKTSLCYYCCHHLALNSRYKDVKMLVSGADREGEGEMKIFEHISQLPKGTRCLVVTSDSDLAVFAMNAKSNFDLDVDILQMKNRGSGALWKCGTLAETIARVTKSTPELSVRDFAFLVTLTGNDYLPALKGFSLPRGWKKYISMKRSNPNLSLFEPNESHTSFFFRKDALKILDHACAQDPDKHVQVSSDPRSVLSFLSLCLFDRRIQSRSQEISSVAGVPMSSVCLEFHGKRVSRFLKVPKSRLLQARKQLAYEMLVPGSLVDQLMMESLSPETYNSYRQFLDENSHDFLANFDSKGEEGGEREEEEEEEEREEEREEEEREEEEEEEEGEVELEGGDWEEVARVVMTNALVKEDYFQGFPQLGYGHLSLLPQNQENAEAKGYSYLKAITWIHEYFRGHCADYGHIYPFPVSPSVSDFENLVDKEIKLPVSNTFPLTPAEVVLYLLPVPLARKFAHPAYQAMIASDSAPLVQRMNRINVPVASGSHSQKYRGIMLQTLYIDLQAIRQQLHARVHIPHFPHTARSTTLVMEGENIEQKVQVLRDLLDSNILSVEENHTNHYTFIDFETIQDAEKAFQNAPAFFPSEPQSLRLYYPSLRSSRNATVVVKGLARNTTVKDIQTAFSQFGTVISCKIVSNWEGKSKGVGVVSFINEKEAETAVEKRDILETILLKKKRGKGERGRERRGGLVLEKMEEEEIDQSDFGVNPFLVQENRLGDKPILSRVEPEVNDEVSYYGMIGKLSDEERRNVSYKPTLQFQRADDPGKFYAPPSPVANQNQEQKVEERRPYWQVELTRGRYSIKCTAEPRRRQMGGSRLTKKLRFSHPVDFEREMTGYKQKKEFSTLSLPIQENLSSSPLSPSPLSPSLLSPFPFFARGRCFSSLLSSPLFSPSSSSSFSFSSRNISSVCSSLRFLFRK